jgi:UDP-glucose 4-epimerase
VTELDKKTCVVTGCAGFVGSHLTEALLKLGHPVLGVDNLFSGVEENMESFRSHPHFEFLNRSITEANLLADLKERRPDLENVFHLAAIVSVPYSMSHPEETMLVNCVSSLALYEEASMLGLRSFVFAGSAAEYGAVESLPLKEGDAIQGEHDLGLAALHASPYGRSKYMVSRYIEGAGYGCSLRFFNIYGPRQLPSSPYSGVISKFVGQALAGLALTIEGDGRQSRDFIYVEDAVLAYLLAAGLINGITAPITGVYNIGLEHRTTILELACLILEECGRKKEICFLPKRQGDIRHSQASVLKFREKTGFSGNVDLREGIRHTLQWAQYREDLYPNAPSDMTCPSIPEDDES